MDRLGIDRAIIMPLNCAEQPTEPQSLGEILTIRDSHPDRFIPFYSVDPRLAYNPDEITARDFRKLFSQYRHHGISGIGELTARVRWDYPPLQAMCAACEEAGFPITFHTTTSALNTYGVLDDAGLPGLEAALKSFPDLVFTGHSPGFRSEISGDVAPEQKNDYPSGDIEPGGAVIRLMREYRNLHADLSGGSGFNAVRRDARAGYAFLAEFHHRLLFGLDCVNSTCETGVLDVLRSAAGGRHVDPDHVADILSGNIARVLKLP
jgi:predicted TIM-barrel fold metal-dependent hydrolase